MYTCSCIFERSNINDRGVFLSTSHVQEIKDFYQNEEVESRKLLFKITIFLFVYLFMFTSCHLKTVTECLNYITIIVLIALVSTHIMKVIKVFFFKIKYIFLTKDFHCRFRMCEHWERHPENSAYYENEKWWRTTSRKCQQWHQIN